MNADQTFQVGTQRADERILLGRTGSKKNTKAVVKKTFFSVVDDESPCMRQPSLRRTLTAPPGPASDAAGYDSFAPAYVHEGEQWRKCTQATMAPTDSQATMAPTDSDDQESPTSLVAFEAAKDGGVTSGMGGTGNQTILPSPAYFAFAVPAPAIAWGLDLSWLATELEVNKKSAQTGPLYRGLKSRGREQAAMYLYLCEPVLVWGPNGVSVWVPQVVRLALESKDGSRVVQTAIDVAPPEQHTALSTALSGFVSCLATSKHGNHVIQKLAKTLAVCDSYQCVALEVLDDFPRIVRDQFGCRVVKKFLELEKYNCFRSFFVTKILEDAFLCWDEYGHFPVETLLDDGLASEQAHIVQTLLNDPNGACHGKGCFVVQKVVNLNLIARVRPLLQLRQHEITVLCSWMLKMGNCDSLQLCCAAVVASVNK